MKIKLNLNRINNHLIHLEKQQRELQKLLDFLTSWQGQLLAAGAEATMVVKEHIFIVNDLYDCVLRRKMYLQSIIEKFADINKSSNENLMDALDALKQQQTVL